MTVERMKGQKDNTKQIKIQTTKKDKKTKLAKN